MAERERNRRPQVRVADRNLRRVRVVLFLLGLPFVASLAALGFEPLGQIVPVGPEMLQTVATVTAAGLLLAIIGGWAADRRALRQQERELAEQAGELALRRQELLAQQAQHELELRLREEKLEKEVAIVRIRELEHSIKLRQLDLERAENGEARPAVVAGPKPAFGDRPSPASADRASDAPARLTGGETGP